MTVTQPHAERRGRRRGELTVAAVARLAGVSAPTVSKVLNGRTGVAVDTRRRVEEYKAKYERIRAKGERVVIDGVCNSACTLVFGIVPNSKICVTPRASIGLHEAYYDKAFTFGIKVTSREGTSELMSYYPQPVKDWLRRNGGLTTTMKKIKNGPDLWKIADPCPDEF